MSTPPDALARLVRGIERGDGAVGIEEVLGDMVDVLAERLGDLMTMYVDGSGGEEEENVVATSFWGYDRGHGSGSVAVVEGQEERRACSSSISG